MARLAGDLAALAATPGRLAALQRDLLVPLELEALAGRAELSTRTGAINHLRDQLHLPARRPPGAPTGREWTNGMISKITGRSPTAAPKHMQTSPFLNEQPRRRLTGLAMRAGVSALAPPGAVHIDVLDREASPRGLYQIRRSRVDDVSVRIGFVAGCC